MILWTFFWLIKKKKKKLFNCTFLDDISDPIYLCNLLTPHQCLHKNLLSLNFQIFLLALQKKKNSAVKEPHVRIFWNFPLWFTLTTGKSGIVDFMSSPGWRWEKLNLNT